jgi:hypothetical protein
MDPSGIGTAVGDIGAAAIQSSAQQQIAQQQAQDQANLEAAATQWDVNYANTEEGALRNAIAGVTAQGNPYMEARSSIAAPTFAAGGTFGPGAGGGASPDPLATGLTGGGPAIGSAAPPPQQVTWPQTPPAQAPNQPPSNQQQGWAGGQRAQVPAGR